jgi:hypothetical protein
LARRFPLGVPDRVGRAVTTENDEGMARMKISFGKLLMAGLATLSLAACSTTGERLGGAGAGVVVGGAVAGPVGAVVGGVAGAIEGPTVSHAMGIPHRGRHYRRHRHHHYG